MGRQTAGSGTSYECGATGVAALQLVLLLLLLLLLLLPLLVHAMQCDNSLPQVAAGEVLCDEVDGLAAAVIPPVKEAHDVAVLQAFEHMDLCRGMRMGRSSSSELCLDIPTSIAVYNTYIYITYIYISSSC
jgi:hypothetical protein